MQSIVPNSPTNLTVHACLKTTSSNRHQISTKGKFYPLTDSRRNWLLALFKPRGFLREYTPSNTAFHGIEVRNKRMLCTMYGLFDTMCANCMTVFVWKIITVLRQNFLFKMSSSQERRNKKWFFITSAKKQKMFLLRYSDWNGFVCELRLIRLYFIRQNLAELFLPAVVITVNLFAHRRVANRVSSTTGREWYSRRTIDGYPGHEMYGTNGPLVRRSQVHCQQKPLSDNNTHARFLVYFEWPALEVCAMKRQRRCKVLFFEPKHLQSWWSGFKPPAPRLVARKMVAALWYFRMTCPKERH